MPLFVNQKWKRDSCFVAKRAGIMRVAETDCGHAGAFGFKFLFVFAQLRDVLAAENSTIMTKKHDYGRTVCP